MTRSERLLSLLQILRRHRRPVSGAALARELGISIRTLYRDIAALQMQGAEIEGEPGVGYILRAGFMLPPLMFTKAELEALVLGARWVSKLADQPLTVAAADALAKISAVLPPDLKDSLETTPLFVGPRTIDDSETVDLNAIREVIRAERKIRITYVDANGVESERVIWPIALGYFEKVRILVAWCEARHDYRHFRADRILAMSRLDVRYPRRRLTMLKEWRVTQPDDASQGRATI